MRIDAHIHYFGDHPDSIAMLERLDLQLLNICVAHGPAGDWRTREAEVYRELADTHPTRYAWCTTFDLPDFKEADYAEGVRQARAAGQKEKEALMQAAAEEEKAIIGKINAAAQAELKEVKAKIAEEVGTVKAALEDEVDAFADAIGKKILGRVA